MSSTTKRKGASKSLSYEQAGAAFTRKQFEPVYFIYGDEEFLKKDLQRQLISTAIAEHERDFNLDIIYGAEAEVGQVVATCGGFPMMAERRVVIVRDFEKLKDNGLLATYAERPNPSTVVALVCRTKPNLSTNPYRALKSKATAIEVKKTKDNQVGDWIVRFVERSGGEIDPRAAQMLGDLVGSDLQTVVAEVDKLTTFAGTRGRIEVDDVIRASGQTREINVFELQKVVGEGQFSASLRIAEQLLRQASRPQGEAIRLVTILSAFFKRLWILTDCQRKGVPSKDMAQKIGISPYFVQDYRRSLRYYSLEAIEKAFETLLAADYELKGGSTREPGLVVTLMLRRLMPSAVSTTRPQAAV